jgi:tetratricopeptide (TPR) repeat protein
VLHNIASIYDALGDSRRALENYNRALELARGVGNKSIEGDTLNNIGTIYVAMGDPAKALSYFDRAAELRQSVMAALWPVADPSTRDFMVEFYRCFGAGTETKAESVRQAQLRLMRGSYPSSSGVRPPRGDVLVLGSTVAGAPFETDSNAPYAHPYYRAPFILFGNWR